MGSPAEGGRRTGSTHPRCIAPPAPARTLGPEFHGVFGSDGSVDCFEMGPSRCWLQCCIRAVEGGGGFDRHLPRGFPLNSTFAAQWLCCGERPLATSGLLSVCSRRREPCSQYLLAPETVWRRWCRGEGRAERITNLQRLGGGQQLRHGVHARLVADERHAAHQVGDLLLDGENARVALLAAADTQ